MKHEGLPDQESQLIKSWEKKYYSQPKLCEMPNKSTPLVFHTVLFIAIFLNHVSSYLPV